MSNGAASHRDRNAVLVITRYDSAISFRYHRRVSLADSVNRALAYLAISHLPCTMIGRCIVPTGVNIRSTQASNYCSDVTVATLGK